MGMSNPLAGVLPTVLLLAEVPGRLGTEVHALESDIIEITADLRASSSKIDFPRKAWCAPGQFKRGLAQPHLLAAERPEPGLQ